MINALYLASFSAIATAAGHSYLSERLFLRPLRHETGADSVFSGDSAKKLVVAMFHLASLFWIGMAVSMLMLDAGSAGHRNVLHVYVGIYAISGIGNFWAVGRPHPGGVMLLLAAALILVALYA